MREIQSKHKIGQYRVAAGLTQKALADLVECAPGTIHLLESGRTRFTREWAVRLSPILNVSATELLSASSKVSEKDAVATRLRDARIASGISSVSSAAKRLELAYWKYHGHENAKLRVSKDDAHRYADAFGVTATWLLTGEGEGPKPVVAPVKSFLPAVVAKPKAPEKRKRAKSLTASDSAKRAWETRRQKKTGLVPLPLPTGGNLVERLTQERDALAAQFKTVSAERDRLERELGVLDTVIGQLSTPVA